MKSKPAHEYIEKTENVYQEPPEEVLKHGERSGFGGSRVVEKAAEGRAEIAAQLSAVHENGQAAPYACFIWLKSPLHKRWRSKLQCLDSPLVCVFLHSLGTPDSLALGSLISGQKKTSVAQDED